MPTSTGLIRATGHGRAPAPGYRRRVVKALLFDRVLKPSSAQDGVSAMERNHYDEDELGASIAEQLRWLLNTRVPIDYAALDVRTRHGWRSTVDYGLPDLTAYPVGDDHALKRLHEHLAQTIALFEPRLHDPAIRLTPIDGRRESMEAHIWGTVRIGMTEAPVSFRFPLAIDHAAPDAR